LGKTAGGTWVLERRRPELTRLHYARIPKPFLSVAPHESKTYTGGEYHLVAKTFTAFKKRRESFDFIKKLFFSRRLPWQKKE
jgi:hypothetical protein